MSAPAVSVVIPARDAAATLPAALRGLERQDLDAAWEVIVVDDGSRDDTAALARAAGARVVVQAGCGPARARNAGAAVARAAALAFTDADCVPAPGWLRAGLVALDGADLVQGRVVADPDAERGPWDRTIDVSRLSGLFETANLFVDGALFARLGGFESWLGRGTAKELGEDVWLGWRAVHHGAAVAFAGEALVHHAVVARGPGGYVAERARLRFFPALARRVPELRETFFHRRFFLSARQARFDLAVAGAALGLGVLGAPTSPRRRHSSRMATAMSPAWLGVGVVLLAPYAHTVTRDARARGARVAAVEIAADALSLAALVTGSLSARSLLL